ncbi:MAG: septal ring lytic transglycosylase RlpA family protein [Succinatimonas sp.]|nr:septal ring lytic transglycosylase RlpA family protein [Succinatimonas sp.]
MIKKGTLFVLASIISVCVIVQGCSSTGSSSTSKYSGAYTYGTGPNNTRPKPQTEKVNLNGVSGSTIRYEVQKSNGTNKDYTVLGQNYQVWRGTRSYIEEGTASWYGPGFHGKKTSLGEVYNQRGYSAAHKNLPLPCYLLVTNLQNGKKIIVRVNDRGPFHGNRILDLSEGAAKYLNITGKGTAKVRVELIDVQRGNILTNATGIPKQNIAIASNTVKNNSHGVNYTSTKSNRDYVQLVSNKDYSKALELMHYVKNKVNYPVFVMQEGSLNRVLVGPLASAEIDDALNSLKDLGFADCFTKKF